MTKRIWRWKAAVLIVAVVAVTAMVERTVADEIATDDAIRRGDMVMSEDFRSEDGGTLRIESPVGGRGDAARRIEFPEPLLRKFAGCELLFRAKVRGIGVSEPPKSYNGVKFMLHVTTPTAPLWLQATLPHETFDWRTAEFIATIPADAVAAELVLGLEAVSGEAEFDDVTATVSRLPVVHPATPQPGQGPGGTAYIGHDCGRLRGAMIGKVNADDLREFGTEWNANHVRWQMYWGGFPNGPADTATADEYDTWLETELQRLDELLPVCAESGILVVIDLHTPPGGRREDAVCNIFQRTEDQQHFLRVWDRISKRYVGNPTVWGYDLVNEPVEGVIPPGIMDWEELAAAAARIVRQNDPDHAIIYEPTPWGSPDSLVRTRPLPDDIHGVVYSVHMYVPHVFTHQGVYVPTDPPIVYPGEIGGVSWGREQMRRALQPVVDFQRTYNVHIYLGEFGAIRWAPDESAYRYLRDCIELAEEFGWDWAYHAFREWDGWSVEHSADRNDHRRTESPTLRKQLLLEWFGKSETPTE